MQPRHILTALGGVALLAVVPLVFDNPYTLSVIILTIFYAYLALSWNIIGGIAGQLSLGHAAYFGIGAYTSTTLFLSFGLSPWIGMLAGAALSALMAVVIGLPCFRLRGAYFALATLAATVILKVIVENSHELLGGPRGLEVRLMHDAPLYFQHTRKEFYYAIVVVMAAVALYANFAILRSRFGYYLTAIRNDQDAALALGVDSRRCKLTAAVLSAVLTSIGGTFYAQYVLFISPEKVFGANLSVQIAVVCIIGGRGTLWGPVLGAALLLPAEEVARAVTGGAPGAAMMLYGLLLMVVMRFEPNGLVAILKRVASRRTAARARVGVA